MASFVPSTTISALPIEMLQCQQQIQALSQANFARPELLDHVRQLLEDDSNLGNRMLEWIAISTGVKHTNVLLPDRGVMMDMLSSIMTDIGLGNDVDVDKSLKDYIILFETSQAETFNVLPQRNLFQLVDVTCPQWNEELRTSDAFVAETETESEVWSTNSLSGDTSSFLNEERAVDVSDALYISYLRQAQRWCKNLQMYVEMRRSPPSQGQIDKIVSTIRDLKKVTKSVFGSASFRRAVKASGLAHIVEEISAPSFLMEFRAVTMLKIDHNYRVGDQLAEVLDRWTPYKIRKRWNTHHLRFLSKHDTGKVIGCPRDVVKIFDTNKDYVPGEENISYCFFLTSFENFRYHYDRWLGPFLFKLGFNVFCFNDIGFMHRFYDQLMKQISDWCKYKQGNQLIIDVKSFHCPQWRLILKHTSMLRKLRTDAFNHARKLSRCEKCALLPPTKRCRQFIFLPHITNGLSPDAAAQTLSNLRSEMQGSGITMVPVPHQLECKLSPEDIANQRTKYTGDLYSPNSVGKANPFELQNLEVDKEIKERCGHQLLLVLDEQPMGHTAEDLVVDWKSPRVKKVIDFVWWFPFDEEKIAILQNAVIASSAVAPVKRGNQFHSYGGGRMTALGSRAASGGRAGDAYTSYAGLEGRTPTGLQFLFQQAASAAIIQATAFHAHPSLWSDMKRVASECDRMGITGANIFNCQGYMAPIHLDRDATRGLSVQTMLRADNRYNEFGFCNVEYKYYISTTTNCLWSFDASNLHGTMLPSKQTVQRLNCQAVLSSDIPFDEGETVSNGVHLTVPARNYKRALENARRRSQYGVRSSFWAL
ncbi:hypothetical protein EV360DRAFT_87009 [Lentinula raphanica]|nr:hypothetical protein EV360DRAFT_87009 [Lentinula raphanica]